MALVSSSLPTTTSALPAMPSALSAALASLVLGFSKPHCVDDDDLALGGAVAEGRTQGELDHLLGGLLVVLARLGPEGHATTAEVRCTGRALASVAGALLLERLLAATADFCTGLGALRARATGGELSGDNLVHDGHVGLDAEHVGVELERAGVLAGGGLEGNGRT